MMGLGPMELGAILLIVLLIFGPKRLPSLGKDLGSGIRNFVNAAKELKPSWSNDDNEEANKGDENGQDHKTDSDTKA